MITLRPARPEDGSKIAAWWPGFRDDVRYERHCGRRLWIAAHAALGDLALVDWQRFDNIADLAVHPDAWLRTPAGAQILDATAQRAAEYGVQWLRMRVPQAAGLVLAACLTAGFSLEGADGVIARLEREVTRSDVGALCEHCRAGIPHRQIALGSISGPRERTLWDQHEIEVHGGSGIVECPAGAWWEWQAITRKEATS